MSVETDIDTSILEAMDFAVLCEAQGHGKGIYVTPQGLHAGGHLWPTDDAEWSVETVCPGCADKSSELVCGGRVAQLTADPNRRYHCGECGVRKPAKDWLVSIKPLGGGREH